MTDADTLRAFAVVALLIACFALVFGLKWLDYRKAALKSGEAERVALEALRQAEQSMWKRIDAADERQKATIAALDVRCNASEELYRKSFQKLTDESRATFQQLKDHYQQTRRKAG